MTPSQTKAALKTLREERRDTIQRVRQGIKIQNKRIADIKNQMAGESKTVPEIAAALGIETADVMITVAALRKYGQVVEGPKDGDYFKYQLVDAST